MAGFESTAWSALLAPKGTPSTIIDQLNGWVNEAIKDPSVMALAQRSNYQLEGGAPSELRSKIQKEFAYWGDVIRTQNIKSGE